MWHTPCHRRHGACSGISPRNWLQGKGRRRAPKVWEQGQRAHWHTNLDTNLIIVRTEWETSQIGISMSYLWPCWTFAPVWSGSWSVFQWGMVRDAGRAWWKSLGRRSRTLCPLQSVIDWRLTLSSSLMSGPVPPRALSSRAMFAAPRTRSISPLAARRLSALTLCCTLSSHYFCYSNFSINYALE